MATLQQLRERTYNLLRETSSDTHFDDSQIRGFLNQAVEYIAALGSPPEDLFDVAAELNKGNYPMPSDQLVIKSLFFGNSMTSSDIKRLELLDKTAANNMFPNWLDETISNASSPTHAWKFDKDTVYIHPRPDANNLKRIYLFYGFIPTAMVSDSDSPQIHNSYHSILPFFACRLCYYQLSQPVMAKEMYAAFTQDYNAIKDNVDKESEETFRFKWSQLE